MQRLPVSVGVGFLLSLLLAVPAFGQGAVSELNGTVLDSSQALLPGVTVTLTEETPYARSIVSTDCGRFVAIAVTPGRYTIKAELGGSTQTRSGVTIAVGQAVTINFTMPVGQLTDQVVVTGETPLIEPTQTQIGTNMSQTDIENLPMQGREQFALMEPRPVPRPPCSRDCSKDRRTTRTDARAAATCIWSTASTTRTTARARSRSRA